MNSPKLKITTKKYVDDTSVISVRLPKDMIRHIDEVAKTTGRTRNEIMAISLEFALNNMVIEDNDGHSEM